MLQDYRRMGLVGLLVLIGLLLTAGCTKNKQLTEGQTAALVERVTQRWATKSAKDFESTWEFSSPSFRAVFPKSLYVRKFSYMVDWELTEVEILNYDSRAAVASVAARVMTEPAKKTSEASAIIGAVDVVIREKWIFIDGEWWHSTNY
jgi:hypothetical protein